jgi:hypothetical protein
MREFSASKISLGLKTLGKWRFYAGLLAGCISAILIALFFNYGREIMRLQTIYHADLLILSPSETRFYNAFFACFAAVLGHTILLWVWMQGHYSSRVGQRLKLQLAGTYLMTIFWVMILVVSRFGFLLPIILFGFGSDDQGLNLHQSHPWLFVLLLMVIFLQGWMAVRLRFRLSWKAMGAGTASVLTMAAILFFTTSLDQDRLNKLYRQQFYADFETIASELERAEKMYGIRFTEQTVAVLEENYSPSAMEQVVAVKRAFISSLPVSLDTIILQNIILQNFKPGHRISHIAWNYVWPGALYHQLSMAMPESAEARELLLLFRTMVEVVNVCVRADQRGFDPTYQKGRRNLRSPLHAREGLLHSIDAVRVLLLSDSNYTGFVQNLPELDWAAFEAGPIGRLYY